MGSGCRGLWFHRAHCWAGRGGRPPLRDVGGRSPGRRGSPIGYFSGASTPLSSPDGAQRNPGQADPGLCCAPSGLQGVGRGQFFLTEGFVMQRVVGVEVKPLSAACGAEVKGIDLTRPLPAATIAAIKEAWNTHLVLVFRGQTLVQDDQLRFASYFGELGDRKKAPEELRGRAEGSQQDNQKILLVSNIKVDGKAIGAFGEGEFWFHIDGGYTPRPYRYTFLYAIEVPSTGGNTMFSNMYKAYEAVPAALREKLRGRKALHIHEYNRAKQANSSGDISGIPHHFHPGLITHPETGRKTLFVDRLMTTRI